MNNTSLKLDKYFHIYNRGVDKRAVFQRESDFERFLLSLRLCNSENNKLMIVWRDLLRKKSNILLEDFIKANCGDKLVEVSAYCLLPNHFHLLLKQTKEKGIETFMHKIATSYTNYFNKKNNRTGSLFEGTYKSVEIDSYSYFLNISLYINGNPEIHKIAKTDQWEWSSYYEYMDNVEYICFKYDIMKEFRAGSEEYQKLLKHFIANSQSMKGLKRLCLE
jgi:putative transposase